VPRRLDDHGGSAEENLIYRGLQQHLPRPLRRYILHFEAGIEDAVRSFAQELCDGARVLDAGAGECTYKDFFARQRYLGIDLGIGDVAWNYSQLDAVADLTAVPFPAGVFDAVVNLVTLEHVREPGLVLAELCRVLKPGGKLLLVVPHEWEEHQTPHDYFRYTRYGTEYLLNHAGFAQISVQPVGGFFRLLSRRLLNALQFFRGPLLVLAVIAFAPPALLLPALDSFDKQRNFTLGFICTARKPGASEI
jgi:SAM-dependent methyltransferase